MLKVINLTYRIFIAMGYASLTYMSLIDKEYYNIETHLYILKFTHWIILKRKYKNGVNLIIIYSKKYEKRIFSLFTIIFIFML